MHAAGILSRGILPLVSEAPPAGPPDTELILNAVATRYGPPLFCFFFGSHAFGRGDAGSDIDLIVVLSRVANAYRETFSSDGYLFDAHVHDPETLHYMMRMEQRAGVAILAGEIDEARVLPASCEVAVKLKEVARGIMAAGSPLPQNWDGQRRYLTAVLSDVERCADQDERWVLAMGLYFRIMELFLRRHGKLLSGPGRHLARSAKTFDALFFDRAQAAIACVFREGSPSALIGLAREVLDLIGGPLTTGFRQDFPETFRLPLPSDSPERR